jgi:predicted ribonuclease YlaK
MDRVVKRENSVQAVVDEFVSDPAVATIMFNHTQRSRLAHLAATSLIRTKFDTWRWQQRQ